MVSDSNRSLPNLFLVGSMKCGTTSLHNYLGAHPQIFMTGDEWKEPAYFVERLNWSKGEEWYRGLFADAGDAVYRGESSTDYTKFPHYEGVAERIARFAPDARILYLLRDPVERSISHYWWEVQWSAEGRDMLTAVRSRNIIRDVSYYALQLRQFLPHFGRERILVLSTEELSRAPEETLHADLPLARRRRRIRADQPARATQRLPQKRSQGHRFPSLVPRAGDRAVEGGQTRRPGDAAPAGDPRPLAPRPPRRAPLAGNDRLPPPDPAGTDGRAGRNAGTALSGVDHALRRSARGMIARLRIGCCAETDEPNWRWVSGALAAEPADWTFFSNVPQNALERAIRRPRLSRYRACRGLAAGARRGRFDLIVTHHPLVTCWTELFCRRRRTLSARRLRLQFHQFAHRLATNGHAAGFFDGRPVHRLFGVRADALRGLFPAPRRTV